MATNNAKTPKNLHDDSYLDVLLQEDIGKLGAEIKKKLTPSEYQEFMASWAEERAQIPSAFEIGKKAKEDLPQDMDYLLGKFEQADIYPHWVLGALWALELSGDAPRGFQYKEFKHLQTLFPHTLSQLRKWMQQNNYAEVSALTESVDRVDDLPENPKPDTTVDDFSNQLLKTTQTLYAKKIYHPLLKDLLLSYTDSDQVIYAIDRLDDLLLASHNLRRRLSDSDKQAEKLASLPEKSQSNISGIALALETAILEEDPSYLDSALQNIIDAPNDFQRQDLVTAIDQVYLQITGQSANFESRFDAYLLQEIELSNQIRAIESIENDRLRDLAEQNAHNADAIYALASLDQSLRYAFDIILPGTINTANQKQQQQRKVYRNFAVDAFVSACQNHEAETLTGFSAHIQSMLDQGHLNSDFANGQLKDVLAHLQAGYKTLTGDAIDLSLDIAAPDDFDPDLEALFNDDSGVIYEKVPGSEAAQSFFDDVSPEDMGQEENPQIAGDDFQDMETITELRENKTANENRALSAYDLQLPGLKSLGLDLNTTSNTLLAFFALEETVFRHNLSDIPVAGPAGQITLGEMLADVVERLSQDHNAPEMVTLLENVNFYLGSDKNGPAEALAKSLYHVRESYADAARWSRVPNLADLNHTASINDLNNAAPAVIDAMKNLQTHTILLRDPRKSQSIRFSQVSQLFKKKTATTQPEAISLSDYVDYVAQRLAYGDAKEADKLMRHLSGEIDEMPDSLHSDMYNLQTQLCRIRMGFGPHRAAQQAREDEQSQSNVANSTHTIWEKTRNTVLHYRNRAAKAMHL